MCSWAVVGAVVGAVGELSVMECNDVADVDGDVDGDDDSCGRDSVVFRIEEYKQRIAELEKMLQK